jgi:plastocyanin
MTRVGLPLLLAAGLIVGLVGACGGGGELDPDKLTPGQASRDLHLTSKSLKFDKEAMAAPANTEVSLTFSNQETVPHNVAIYADSSAKEKLFTTETFAGPKVESYSFVSPGTGRYYFRCDVHPTMDGYLFVE